MASPDTAVYFGPKQFLTTTNNVQVNFVESFSVPPLPAPGDTTWGPAANQYTIRLQRVGGSVTIATVAINGTQVAAAADFASATYIERTITVNQANGNTNSLTITLKGAAAAGLTATIVGVPDGTFAIFGPKVYSKGVTTPSHYTENFSLPSGASAPYAVSARASVAGTKATITVNGVQVVKDTDFGTNVTYVIKSALLSTSNTMQVDVRGTTGTTITVTVLATDKTPPTLSIAAPASNLVTNAASVTVSGTSQDVSATQVKVNSVIATMSGTQYSATVPLVVGANSIAVRATDRAGNHVDSARTVTRDTLPPTLTVTSPADSSYTSSNSVTVAGTFSDATPVTVKANGVLIGQSSPFSGTLSGITAGTNFVTITATDAAGNVTSQVRRVTQVTTPPVLTVSSPTQTQLYDGFGFYTNITPIQVSGTVSGAAPMTLTVNGASTPINNGTFSASVPLIQGWNTITIIATGPSGLVRQEVVRGRLNTSPPSFSIDIPHDPNVQSNYPWATAPTTVFTIYPQTYPLPSFPYVSATLNGVALTVDSTGRYSGPVPLVEGTNAVTAMVTDNAGRVGVRTDTIILDSHPPVVELTSPAEGAHFTTEPVLVSGTSNSGVEFENLFEKLWLSVNGVQVANNGPFSTEIHLDSGTNVITIEAREASGNITTLTRTVTFGAPLDNLPPDPATIAPVLNPTIATTTFAATSFLYTGPSPIQTGVVEGTIQPLQAAVIRGSVRARTGDALPAVTVTVLGHPEFGQTLSRADGAFDLVVNGGKPLTVNYQKTGFLPAQRTVSPIWQDYTSVDSVTLIALDAAVTNVDFSQPTQVAQGTPVTDASGTRQATVLFKSGTHAALKFADGTTQPLNSIAVRATEYTVGPTGPSAMPAELPPTTAYTYAVELSVDTAIAAGAKSVVFDQPVSFYVDNFLNFPTGTPVPVGYYDRQSAQWIASPNGRVIKVLQIANGRASLDLDGSGTEATPESLTALGLNEPELERLGILFAAGKSFWRVSLTHFSTIDLNEGFDFDTTSVPPTNANPTNQNPPDNDCHKSGSIIGCERQTLGESLPIAGTSLTLNYQSDRVPGYKQAYSADIPLIGSTVPLNLTRIQLEVRIAGTVLRQTYSNQPNQTAHFVWDGKDPYGRPIQGSQLARIRIGYVYPTRYARPLFLSLLGDFGNYASEAVTQDPARSEATLWQDMTLGLGTNNRNAEGLGGWGIDVHHYYDPMGQVLYLGDGTRRTGAALYNSATTIAGANCAANCANAAKPGDRAVDAYLGTPGMTVAQDGTMYLNDDNANKIWRVNAAGNLELVGGNGTANVSGDSIAAISAGMVPNAVIQAGPDGSIYFTDNSAGGRIRRIDKNGILTTVAGTGVCGTAFVDGTLAARADLCFYKFALGKDGSVYVEDRTEVYRVGADGILKRIVGDGTYATCPFATPSYICAEGKPANGHAVFHRLNGITVGADGTLYVANSEARVSNGMVIYRIGVDGIIHRVAGNGNASGPLVNGLPAKGAAIVSFHTEMAVGADGSLYYTEQDGYVYRVDEKGILRVLAGCVFTPGPATCSPKSGGRATLTTLFGPRSVGFGPDGRLYIADNFARRIDAPMPALGINVLTVASEDGSEIYVFDPDGKHLRTVDAVGGSTVFSFNYDSAGLLASILDGDGNTITVERDGAGVPVAIVAPFGQRTVLTMDGQHYLSSVQAPGQPSIAVVHAVNGLLSSITDLGAVQHQFTYDINGLLTRDDNGSSGFTTLARTRTDSSSSVTLTSAMGVTATHSTTARSVGGSRRVSIDGVGLATTVVEEPNGAVTTTTPDGIVTTIGQGSDPRFGMQSTVLNRITTRTPSGLVATTSGGRRAVLSNSADPTTLVTQVDSSILNGRVFRSTYVAATRTVTALTPAGRSSTETFDALGRVVAKGSPGIAPLQYQYDSRGRVAQMTRGPRQVTFAYDALGRLSTTMDPLSHSDQLFYDSGDRLTRHVLQDSREVLFEYDASGHVQSLTPPGRPAHQFQYNAAGLLVAYIPPNLGAGTWSTTFQYDADGRLTQVTRPDGQIIGFGFDAAGRQSSATVPGGSISFSYNATTGMASGATGPYGGGLAFTYDGSLLTGVTWSGEVAGSLTATYNTNFQVSGLSMNGDTPIAFGYDNDGQLIQAGDLTVAYDATNDLLTGTTLGPVTTALTYSSLGELASETASVNASPLFDVTYHRDAIGRIADLTESVEGVATTKAYTYDLAGRLSEVRQDGVLSGIYEYDSNSNRIRLTRPAGVETGTYDDQDRLVTYAGTSYAYGRNGELSKKVSGNDSTRYEYDVLGNLRRVTLPDGTVIDYVADALNRRVGKKVNGVLVKGWLYQDRFNPIVEVDAAGNVASRFVYGAGAIVPDYMIRDGTTYRIIADRLGSVRLVVNASTGSVVQRLDYDEFGRVLTNTNPGFQPFGFAGGLYDEQTQLVRFGQRDYDPQAGRWTAKDPAAFGGQDVNLYSYGSQDPINTVDGSGRFAVVPIILVTAAIGGAVNGLMDVMDVLSSGCPSKNPLWKTFRNGAIAGAAGVVAAEVALFGTENTYLAAAAGSAVTSGVEALLGADVSPTEAVMGTVFGGVAGGLAKAGFRSKIRGREPSMWKPRPIKDLLRPNTKAVGGREALGDAAGGAAIMAGKHAGQALIPCPCGGAH